MVRGSRWLMAMLLLAVAMASCNSPAVAPPEQPTAEPLEVTEVIAVEGGGAYTNVNPAGLAAMLARKDFLLVNVHVPYEGEIEPTDRFLSYRRIADRLDQLPPDKDARLVLYCRSGSMSAKAARALVREGYTDVWHLNGGMNAWREAGYPVVDKPH